MSYMRLTEGLAKRHLGYVDGGHYLGPDITDLEPLVESVIDEVLTSMIYELARAKLRQSTGLAITLNIIESLRDEE